MLAEVSPEQFDEVVAFNRLEPDILDRIRIVLKYGLSAISQGLPAKPSDLDPIAKEAPPARNTHSPQQALAALQMAYGSQ